MELLAIIISGISLLIAIVSFAFSLSAQHLQNKVNQLEVKLKQYELAEKEKENTLVSCVEARISHIMENKYKVKVWNSGNLIAKNITVDFGTKPNIIISGKEKMPFEILEPQKSFELSISRFHGSPSKLYLTTMWENENGDKKSKQQLCDFS